jgi:methionine-rich copper-binding protein CopC
MSKSLLTLLLIAAAGPAWAHAILVQSTPAALSHVKAGPITAILRYNSRIDAARSKLTLTGPNGPAQRLAVTAGDTPDSLHADITLAPGAYTLRWQVLATDGHITRGNVPFTVDAP